ncbi:imidazoleglycerol-phosphate dehydratase [Desulfacinum hydrothermale DSM 13146]|uniref:Imidazoleglycerol-phosphate dehydratase n=1 Tax=Desulfacinum hydrothermale DSM 13146 TaxID=1121390 RepID=A0A1W1WYD9_9BACT|nr:imidazoleglycerol-phosphate dehydratase HisB [Desulfacinum hydrothermale]SMC16746.1 imidazoleglycerol-phosphate dehydratase [Desulfacinum hydrothermale DSM 13146]
MSEGKRSAFIERKTKETAIAVQLDLDGSGSAEVNTGIAFFDHMLTLFAVHGFFDLTIRAQGDLDVDGHHTVEDVGICLGQAFSRALGDRAGIRRYGQASVPMDEALAQAVVDLPNRPYLVLQTPALVERVGAFETELLPEFFRAFCVHAGATLHLHVPYGDNTHHMLEAVFKACGRALDQATSVDPRRTGVPSSKGIL